MRPPESRGDYVFMGVLNALLLALGLAMLASPPRRLPTDLRAYEAIDAALAEARDLSGRKSTWIEFRVQADPRWFESRAAVFRGQTDRWVPGVTRLQFHTERRMPADEAPRRVQPALALIVDGQASLSLPADIERAHAGMGRWGGLLPAGLSLLGCVAMAVHWRRHRAGPAVGSR